LYVSELVVEDEDCDGSDEILDELSEKIGADDELDAVITGVGTGGT
jgi:hypothetical protein